MCILANSVELLPKLLWFAVRVRVRREEAISSVLREKNYDVINPTFTEVRRYSDRTRKVRCAIFPGYVFVAMDPEKVLHLIATAGVHYVVRSGTDLQPLSDKEVRAIQALCQIDAKQSHTCKPCPVLQVGQKVIIEAGPLKGVEGILVKVMESNRVIVTVESLNSSVSVEIGHVQVRLLNDGCATDSLQLSNAS